MLKSTLQRLWLSLVCISLCSLTQSYAGVIYSKKFQGEEQEVGVLLSWSTSSEDGSALFIIERATDGEEFESIGAIGGAGDSDQEKEYNFFDFNIHGSYILYRLKQTDKDGAVTYSKTLFINKTNENDFTVSRMSDVIATENFAVTFDMMKNANIEYNLKNAKGEVVMNEKMKVEKGLNDIIIDMEDADLGAYELTLSVNETTEVINFEKRKSEKQKNQSVTAKKY